MLFFATAYFIAFAIFAWVNFRWAVGLLIVLLPTYLIRFSFGSLPSTLLELMFVALFLVWLVKHARDDWQQINNIIVSHKLLFIFVGLFFAASLIGIFNSGMVVKSLGLWRAYFLEPIILFFILLGRRKEIRGKDLIWFLSLSALSISILAIIQKFTGHFYPPSLWDDELNGRVVSFFTSPNAVGLYLGPIMMLVVAMGYNGYKKFKITNLGYWVLLIISVIAIFFTKSDGAWIALVAGMLVFIFLIGYKKIAIVIALAGIILAFIAPTLRQAVLFQDKAGQNRLVLWNYSINYLASSPKNFILGAGIRQFFNKVQKPHYNVKEMERLIYPHNIFLNFWTEIGLIGALSFMGIISCLFFVASKVRAQNKILAAGLMACLAVFIIHGLVDVPYFKNDLAMMFWVIASLMVD